MRQILMLAVAAACVSCAVPVDDESVELTEPLVASEPVEDARNAARERLDALYVRALARGDEALEPRAREAAVALRAEHGEGASVPLRMTVAGTPRQIIAPGFAVLPEELGLQRGERDPEAIASAFLEEFAALWRVDAAFMRSLERLPIERHESPDGLHALTVRMRQHYRGLVVRGGEIAVHIDEASAAVIGVTGSILPIESDIDIRPTVPERDARSLAEDADTSATLVVWSGLRSGGSAEPKLAWELRGHAASERIFIDAETGETLSRVQEGLQALRRTLWDLQGNPDYQMDTCQRWQISPPFSFWPAELIGCTHSACAACATDQSSCARCACGDSEDPASCENAIWQYDDLSGGCVGNGVPVGEPSGSCDSESLALWNDTATAYSYWKTAFSRDGWNGSGGWMRLKSNHPPSYFAGVVQAQHVEAYTTPIDFVQLTIADGLANPFLHGHELGHTLQLGLINYDPTLTGMYNQSIDVLENNADVHSRRYQNLTIDGVPYCTGSSWNHYTQFSTANAGQINKNIGNCHASLLSRSGPTTHYGVTVSPVTPVQHDRIVYRALDLYFSTGDDYFDWWNQVIASAVSLSGAGSPSTVSSTAARDAIGGWTGLSTLPVGVTGVRSSDRFAAVGWQGATRAPCVFYRYSGSTTAIYWTCREGSTWRPAELFNDPAIDPAASEPAATFRYDNGNKIYVFWRSATDNRIRYRTFNPSSLVIGAPSDMGPTHLTATEVGVAPIYETSTTDRLVVVYHPIANPRYFYGTHLGSSTYTDLGPAMDSIIAPAVTPFPYEGWDEGTNRIYLIRPNDSGPVPGHFQYASYSLSGGWSGASNLSVMYLGDTGMITNVVRSDRPVALAEYNRSTDTTRLRMTFVTTGAETGGQRELWYGTFRQVTPGVLDRALGYRAVPLAPVGPLTHQSAGALSVGSTRAPLWHFWGDTGPSGKLAAWQTASD